MKRKQNRAPRERTEEARVLREPPKRPAAPGQSPGWVPGRRRLARADVAL